MSQSVARALAIVDMCERGPQSINDIAAALGVHPTTALRLAHDLSKAQYLRHEGGLYRLGPRLAALGAAVLSTLDLRSVAGSALTTLSSLTGETVHLAERIGPTVVYVDKVESVHPLRMYSQVGRSAPLHCTGVGKAILAGSPDLLDVVRRGELDLHRFTDKTITSIEGLLEDCERIRARGYSEDDEEHETTINCIAVSILDTRMRPIGAVSIAAPVHRLPLAALREFAPDLMSAARDISLLMGMPHSPQPA